MKNDLLILSVIILLTACNNHSLKELEAKRIADSVKTADSIAMVQAEQQRIADSIYKLSAKRRIQDSINSLPPPISIDSIEITNEFQSTERIINIYIHNNTNNIFSTVELHCYTEVTTKDGKLNKFDGWTDHNSTQNLKPHSSQKTFVYLYSEVPLSKTPLKATFTVTAKANSIEDEIDGPIGTFNYLPSWILWQKKAGLR